MTVRRQALVNARLFDSATEALRQHTTLVIEGGRIPAVTQQPLQVGDAEVIDAAGRVVLPGYIDAHVHVMANSRCAQGSWQRWKRCKAPPSPRRG